MLVAMILFVFAIMLISLFSGLYFLFVDKAHARSDTHLEKAKKVNTLLTSLILRVTCAIILITLLIFGFVTEQLGNHAPWALL